MKDLFTIIIVSLSLITICGCSKQEDVIITEELINPIRIELEDLVSEMDIDQIWATNLETCSNLTFYIGTPDFEFLEHFVRIQDKYFLYESLVSFEIDIEAGGNQMLLCFN